jgi:hypothetical protein
MILAECAVSALLGLSVLFLIDPSKFLIPTLFYTGHMRDPLMQADLRDRVIPLWATNTAAVNPTFHALSLTAV